MQIDLLIFDLDGTLVNSKQAIVDSINFMLRQLGKKEKSAELISSYIGIGDRNLIWQSVDEDDVLLEQGLALFRADYPQRIVKEGQLFTGIREMLEHFKDKKMAVVSNGLRQVIKLNLEKHGLSSYFDVLVGGDNENCAKPSPCQLEKVMRELNIKPDKTLMVGDLALDIMAGKNAQTHTCAVTYGIGTKIDLTLAKPEFMIDDIRELKQLIN